MSDVQLDQAARQTFLELGPSAPVADVARRLGVSQAALFHRVGSKEALMLRSLCPGVPEALAVWLRPPSAGQPLAQQLQPVLSELLGFLRAAIPGLLVLRSGGVPLEKAMPPGPPPPVALRAALATFPGRSQQARVDPFVVTTRHCRGAAQRP
jgi:AcrR family transcriptional regulator